MKNFHVQFQMSTDDISAKKFGESMAKKKSEVNDELCVSCGCCLKVCPKDAIKVKNGMYAIIDEKLCIGCGKCVVECPSSLLKENTPKEKIRFVLKNGMTTCGFSL